MAETAARAFAHEFASPPAPTRRFSEAALSLQLAASLPFAHTDLLPHIAPSRSLYLARSAVRREAEALAEMVDMLALLKTRAKRVCGTDTGKAQ